jgi:Flp pilus assembly protein TadD
MDLRRWADAAQLLTAGLADDPSDDEGWCRLSQCQFELGRTAEALDSATRAIAVDPASGWAYCCAAVAALRLGLRDEAERFASEAVAVTPDDWVAYVVLATVLDVPERRTEAWLAAVHAVELAPHEADTHEMVGRLALGFGWRTHAETAFERALALDPTHEIARHNLGVLRLTEDRLAEGLGHLGAVLRMSPSGTDTTAALDGVARHLVGRSIVIGLFVGFGAVWAAAFPSPLFRAALGVGLLVLWLVLSLSGLRGHDSEMRGWAVSALRRDPLLAWGAAAAVAGVSCLALSTPLPRAQAGVLVLLGALILMAGGAPLLVRSMRA